MTIWNATLGLERLLAVTTLRAGCHRTKLRCRLVAKFTFLLSACRLGPQSFTSSNALWGSTHNGHVLGKSAVYQLLFRYRYTLSKCHVTCHFSSAFEPPRCSSLETRKASPGWFVSPDAISSASTCSMTTCMALSDALVASQMVIPLPLFFLTQTSRGS